MELETGFNLQRFYESDNYFIDAAKEFDLYSATIIKN